MNLRPNHNALPVGYRLHSFEIKAILGQGGFGVTYLAEDTGLGRLVAIKEFLPSELAIRTSDSAVHPITDKHQDTFAWGLDRFLSEARTLARFKHPNIVAVFSVFEANSTAYMVMEYEQGASLEDAIRRRQIIDEASLLGVLHPLLDGLAQVHEAGFIHRDIKPDNVFLRTDGVPVLLDFGSARQALGGETRTLTSLVTPGYAPFEQYNSTRENDRQGPWTDIYALGASLHRVMVGRGPIEAVIRADYLLAGEPDPFSPLTTESCPGWSAQLCIAVNAALQFRSTERPQTISDWVLMLPAPPHVTAAGAGIDSDAPAAASSAAIPTTDIGHRPSAADAAPTSADDTEKTVIWTRPRAASGPLAGASPSPGPGTGPGTGAPTKRVATPRQKPDTAASKNRGPMIATVVVLICGLGGAAAWWLLQGQAPAPAKDIAASAAAQRTGSERAAPEAGASPRSAAVTQAGGNDTVAAPATPTDGVPDSARADANGTDSATNAIAAEDPPPISVADAATRSDTTGESGTAGSPTQPAGAQADPRDPQPTRTDARSDVVTSARTAPTDANLAASGGTDTTAISEPPPGQAPAQTGPRTAEPTVGETGPLAAAAREREMEAQRVAAEEVAARARAEEEATTEREAQARETRRLAEAQASAAQAKAQEAAALQAEINQLLTDAQADLAASRLTTPASNNAFERFEAVLERDPDNSQAAAGLDQIVGQYLALVDRALDRQQFDNAERFLDRAATVRSEHPELTVARTRVREAREAARQARTADAARLEAEDTARAQAQAAQAEQRRAAAEAAAAARAQSTAQQQAGSESSSESGSNALFVVPGLLSIGVGDDESATTAPKPKVQTPARGTRYAIFPFKSQVYCYVPIDREVVGQLTAEIDRAGGQLGYSHYGSRTGRLANESGIWASGSRPNASAMSANAKALGADRVLTTYIRCSDNESTTADGYRVDVFLLDRATGRLSQEQVTTFDVNDAARRLIQGAGPAPTPPPAPAKSGSTY